MAKTKKNLIFISVLVLMFHCSGYCLAGESQAKDALSVIHSRKSVRSYTGKKVTKDQLLELLRSGMAAPSARNMRPWRFIAVTDENALKKLAEGLPYTKMITKAGACIVVCADMARTLSGAERDFWIQDCSAASENILLAAEAMGLGAVWSGMHPIAERTAHVRKVLGIPDQVIPLNVIAVGYPQGTDKPQDKFEPGNIHWEKW